MKKRKLCKRSSQAMTFVNIFKSLEILKLWWFASKWNINYSLYVVLKQNLYFLRTKQQYQKASVDSRRRRKLDRLNYIMGQHIKFHESLSEHRTNALISIPSIVSTIICSFWTVTKHEIGSWELCEGKTFVETFIEPNQCHHDCVEKKSNLF